MRAPTKKAQVVLTARQYELLESFANDEGITVSALVRDNLERTLLVMLEKRRRQQALDRLFSQELPVDDWETIERNLEDRWRGHDEE